MEANKQKDRSRLLLAFILIGVGMIWLLRQMGIHFNLFALVWDNLWAPFRIVFNSMGHVFFSWQLLMIIVGVILLIGRRMSVGIVLIVMGGIFLLPELFAFPVFTASFILPVLLIGAGVVIVARLL